MKRFVLLVICVAMTACGSGEVPVESNNGDPMVDPDAGGLDSGGDETNEAFRSVLAGACEKAFDCCDVSIARGLSGVNGAADCQDNAIQGFSAATVGGVSAAVRAGTVEVDASAADLCRQALAEAACEDWSTTEPLALDLPGCSEIISPQLNAGDPCEADYECITERCVDIRSGGKQCAELVDAGMACDPPGGILCKSGSYCDNFEAFACVELFEAGRSCVADLDCASQRCEEGPEGTNVCVEPGSVCEDTPL